MPLAILMADDDPDDLLLAKQAFEKTRLANDLRTVEDGEELLDYLHQRGAYAAPGAAPRPALVLLDLNMPRKDGREALREIKADPSLRHIPVVVLTSSKEERDMVTSYKLGVNAYVVKPVDFHEFVNAIKELGVFWAIIKEPPPGSIRK